MEVIIPCSDGVQLSAKHWKSAKTASSNNRIVCLHGWMDNAASFHLVAPALHSNLNADILAIEFPGHGHSSHKSPDGPTQLLSEYALYVFEALSSFGWIEQESSSNSAITLVGHSMGGSVSLIFAAAFPEHVKQVVSLEGSILARNPVDVSKHIRNAILRRSSSNRFLYPHLSASKEEEVVVEEDSKARTRTYSSLDVAITTRMRGVKLLPGNQYASREAMEALVCRGAIPADNNKEVSTVTGEEELTPSYSGPVMFRHDQRLHWPSLQYLVGEQVDALYNDVQCPTLLLKAKEGWPTDNDAFKSITNILQPIVKEFPGSHYFHADPDTASEVIHEVIEFLKKDT